jgi:two-component system phosphate regulon sensor histidine kinase PhoR
MLTFTPGDDVRSVRGEINQLSQVVTNLIANALNYTRRGYVHVSTYQPGDQACLQVEDTGMGIEAVDLPHIFDRFYRGQRPQQSDVPGTGLGLAIVKEIVDLHQGRVEVKSAIGLGTMFQVWLPMMKAGG